MAEAKNKSEDITTLDNHSPVPPSDDTIVTMDNHSPVPPSDVITTMDNHSPAPPALDLDGK
ncbi:sigma-like protein [Streptomyces sp. NPDC096205]|uniref:sigma-like protein n=1 Tax=Streptomyces sp. NPDC096205 TaxID=3366081 RepID=UPI003810EC54